MRKKEIFYFILITLTIAILYFGMAALSVTLFWSMNDNILRLQAFVSMILSGVITFLIFKPITYKKFNGRKLLFLEVIILAILVANVFRAAVTPFSMGYISLMIGTLYLLIKD